MSLDSHFFLVPIMGLEGLGVFIMGLGGGGAGELWWQCGGVEWDCGMGLPCKANVLHS